MIFKIAKKELLLLFYSPIAWLLMICFTVQTALRFMSLCQPMVFSMEDQGGFYDMSNYLFSSLNNGSGGLWESIQGYLFLYIPLLTMGIVNNEIASGAVKLMYSSPVRNYQIILGKFTALVGYALIMMIPLVCYIIFGWIIVDNFHFWYILTGLLGLFLLICTYMAIGLFMSSITTHQSIAAICSFLVFMFLGLVGNIGQQIDFVREITYWLSINSRTETFIRGIISSENLIYFPTTCALFLSLATIRLNALREKEAVGITAFKNTVVVVLLSIVALVSSYPSMTFYFDSTIDKRNTISEQSQRIVERLEGETTITAYVNIFEKYYDINYKYPDFIMENQNAFREYTRFNHNIKVETVYYYTTDCKNKNYKLINKYPALTDDQLADKFCEIYKFNRRILKTKAEVDAMADLSEMEYMTVREFVSANGNRKFFWVDGDVTYHYHEEEISMIFRHLLDDLFEIGLITTPNEQGILGARNRRYLLLNGGFDVENVTMDSLISQDYTLLILSDPRDSLSEKEEQNLVKYINDGGNLMIMGEPRRRDILNPFLEKHLGVSLTPIIVQLDERFGLLQSNLLLCYAHSDIAKNDINFPSLRGSKILLEGASGVDIIADKGFDVVNIFKCDTLGMAWTELETTDFEDEPVVTFNPAVGEVSKTFATVIALTRNINGREQKIIVTGDSDMVSNDIINRRIHTAKSNGKIMDDLTYWVSDYQVPLKIHRDRYDDKTLSLSVKQYDIIKWLFLVVIPLLITTFALILWIRRRGR